MSRYYIVYDEDEPEFEILAVHLVEASSGEDAIKKIKKYENRKDTKGLRAVLQTLIR